MSFKTSVYQRFDSGSGSAGSEVVAVENGLVFVTNGAEERIDVFNAVTGAKVSEANVNGIDHVVGLNSVAVSGGLIVAAVSRSLTTGETTALEPGVVAFFNLAGQLLNTVSVGYGPDMVTFSPDGSKVFVANEGEPSSNGENNPGSISIIDLSQGVLNATHTELNLTQFDGQEDTLRAQGVRIFPGQKASEDFEPEYIAFSPDGQTAFVTLQEANSVLTIDMASLSISGLLPLGTVDHSVIGNALDASDRDDGINIANWPVQGLRMPDAIASYSVDGTTYFVTANEGDDRGENVRVKDISLDPSVFPDAASLQANENLGRLNVSSIDGDVNGDGLYEALYSYGSRSFSIFDASGQLVFDSGEDFERAIASIRPDSFNVDGDEFDARSDNKGPEPEAVAIGEIDGRSYAFIGLERDSGIMVYDITNPEHASFVSYIDSSEEENFAPEIIKFIDASDSLSGKPQLAVAYEGSGTTVLLDIDEVGLQRTAFKATAEAAYVERLYDGLFGRDGDTGGIGYWVHQQEAGMSRTQVADYFLQSAEAGQLGLGAQSNTDFVGQLYAQVLGRAADTEGFEFWNTVLNNGAQRSEVVMAFAESTEAMNNFSNEHTEGVQYDLWVA
ncbi:alkaline phosphatase/hypothetical protein [Azomonas agilis]|uniref:Uncharacterized protein n=1 Tax=Azomonas agilis TaxID=116849 RepID=A0A562IYX1_9GAMM|nr:choice-of-anchor I family protein [Azomonas agilis]TWH76053.1 alkaline phosphatase/hypothetical protein [Azomonas agilis]